jgi:hypothetical protein
MMKSFPFAVVRGGYAALRFVNLRFNLALGFVFQGAQFRLAKGRHLLLAGFVSARVDFEPYQKSYTARTQDQYQYGCQVHDETSLCWLFSGFCVAY